MRYLAICFLLVAVPPASAGTDYDPPTFEEVVRNATAIVDATVEGFTEKGHATLRIHEHLKGKDAPTTITHVWLSCTRPTPRTLLKAKTRYVLCLRKDGVFEESTAYEVRTCDDNVIECNFRDPRSGKPEWIPLSEFRAKLATIHQILVIVKGKTREAVVKAGQPIPICVTVANDLKGAIEFRGYGVKPTDWNAETVSISLVDIYRDGKPEGLFLARPVVKPPHEIAELARTVIAPGEQLTIETDATKWTIKGGWVPARYRVNVRVEGLKVDEYSTLNVSSEPFEFEITATPPSEKTKKAVQSLNANLDVLILDLVFRGKPHQFTDSLTLLGPKVVYERDVDRPVLQLTTAQVAKIIDHLADSGFFERATDLKGQTTVDVPKGPAYTLSVRVGSDGSSVPDGGHFCEDLGWDLKMLHRLDGLRTAISGDAAEAMDRLLARLAPQRREWKKGEALKRGIDSFGLHIRYHGNGDEDRRFPSLMLSVPPIEEQKKDLRGPVVRIDCEQALRIIDLLSDFHSPVRRNELLTFRDLPVPCYGLYVHPRDAEFHVIYLRWGPETVEALAGIRKVLEGEAAEAMDKLLAALEAGPQEWDKPAAGLQRSTGGTDSPELRVLSANSWRWVGPLSRTGRQYSVVWTFQAGPTGTFVKEIPFTTRGFGPSDSEVISNTCPVTVDSVFLTKSVHGRSLVFTWGIAHGDLVVPAVVRTGSREWVFCMSEEFSDGQSRTEECRYRFDADLSEAARGRVDVIRTTKTWRSKKPAHPPRTDWLVISGDYTVEKGDYIVEKSGVGLRRDNLEVRIRSPGVPGFSFDPETAVGIIRGNGRVRSIVYSAAIDPRETVPSAETKMPDIAALTEALKSESSDRLKAASALGNLGADAAPAVPALIESLKIAHRNDLISDALAKVGHVAFPALVEALQDTNPNVRTGAAAALGKIGPEATAAVPALIQSLPDPEMLVRVHVIHALGRIGGEARTIVPSLVDSLKDQDSSVRYAAERALGEIGPGAKAAVPDLTAILQSEDEPGREGVAEALGDIGPEARAAVPAIRAAVNAKHHSLPNRAIEALTRIDADAAVSTLIELLADESRPGLRLNAAYFLGTLSSNAKPAIPALSDALKDENVLVRREAAEALGQIGPEADSAVPPLIEATQDPDPFVRVLAVKSLGLLVRSARTAFGPLSRALNDPHPGVRYSAAVALGNIGIPDETVPPLIEALKDADKKVRRAAAESLGKIGSGAHAARPALTAALNDPTEEVRIVAAQALKVSKVMNKKMKDSWIDAKSKVFFHNERTPAVMGSKRATFDVESSKGAFTTVPATAFVTPSGRKWMGPEQDYYIETDSGIMGFRMRDGGTLFWCSSLTKEPARKVESQSEKDDPSSGFEETVSGSDLFDAWICIDPDARRQRITSLRQGISWWFFTDSPASSQTGMATIVSAEINNGQLKSDLINQTEEYTASVWIDIKSKKVVKATEIKERIKPN